MNESIWPELLMRLHGIAVNGARALGRTRARRDSGSILSFQAMRTERGEVAMDYVRVARSGAFVFTVATARVMNHAGKTWKAADEEGRVGR